MINWAEKMRPLTPEDAKDMIDLQTRVLDALPDRRWYFPSDLSEFAEECALGRVTGIRIEGRLMAFGIACRGSTHHGEGYAARCRQDEPNSLDFQDVMVDASLRRQGVHSAFLALYDAQARRLGCTAIYATVDPENLPSRASFEKAGYRAVVTQPAYDGRIRVYYRKPINPSEA